MEQKDNAVRLRVPFRHPVDELHPMGTDPNLVVSIIDIDGTSESLR